MVPNRSNKHYAKPHPRDRFARALLLGLLETAVALAVTPASLEALLPCPGRREIYLREIVCEYCTYSNLCNPSELSLRTLKRYRSLYPLTRQCLQPEGIVQVYGKCYCGVNVGVLGLRSRTELHDKVHGVLKIRIYRIVNK